MLIDIDTAARQVLGVQWRYGCLMAPNANLTGCREGKYETTKFEWMPYKFDYKWFRFIISSVGEGRNMFGRKLLGIICQESELRYCATIWENWTWLFVTHSVFVWSRTIVREVFHVFFSSFGLSRCVFSNRICIAWCFRIGCFAPYKR